MTKRNAKYCLKCKQETKDPDDDVHYIFDENGVELQLQKLLKTCFDIKVVKRRGNEPFLCTDCCEQLVDAYDLLQRNDEKIDESEQKPLINDIAIEDNKKITRKRTKKGAQKPIKEEPKTEVSNKRTRKGVKTKIKEEPRIENEISKIFSESTHQPKDDPLEIEQVYLSSKKGLEKYFIHDDVDADFSGDDDKDEDYVGENEENEKDVEDIDGAVSDEDDGNVDCNSSDDECGNSQGKSEEDVNIERIELETNESSINIYEYKKSIIRIDPMDINFKNTVFCVYCKKDVIFHKNTIEHAMKHHKNEEGIFKCIAKENCGKFDNARDFAFHLIVKHYDLMFLKIPLHCPECKEKYQSFLEFNEHYCCVKGVINRSTRVCLLCNIEFPSHKRFRVHQMFHLPQYRPKICFLCDKVFKMEEDFYDHIAFFHKTQEELKLTCKLCDKVSTTPELHKKHKKLHLKDTVAKCNICSNSYRAQYLLTLHKRHVHEDRADNYCKVCGKEFHFKGQLKLHLERHNDSKIGKVFVCSVCGLCEPDMASFESHPHKGFVEESTDVVYACEFCELAYIGPGDLKVHRAEVQHVTYDCDICEETFNRYPLLKTHRLTHDYGNHKISNYPTGRKYLCSSKTCDGAFIHFHDLRKHNYTHNWLSSAKTCQLCRKKVTNYEEMIDHLEAEHSDVPLDNIAKRSCTVCQKMFRTKNGLNIHMSALHGDNEYKCNECDRSFKTERILANHKKALHGNSVCHICGKTLRTRHLPYHIDQVHKKIIRFRCDECDKGYYLNSDLQDHKKLMHDCNKPEKCPQCKFSCHYPARLKLHILQKHEGKPAPFQCPECPAGFFTENTLRSHSLKHGERPYSCLVPECKSKFYTRPHLISHGRKVHKKDFTHDAPKIRRKKTRRSKEHMREERALRELKRRRLITYTKDDLGMEEDEEEADQEEELYQAMEIEYLEEEFIDPGEEQNVKFEVGAEVLEQGQVVELDVGKSDGFADDSIIDFEALENNFE
ncbi:hypothetical protein ACFFRR_007800 [Megaselia abdita]